ncbi:MAG: hypothetical protein ACRCYZ_02010 [Alphaproteobacteria bacterium]
MTQQQKEIKMSTQVREMAIGHAAMLFLCNVESWQQGFEQYELLCACDSDFACDLPESVIVSNSYEGFTPNQIADEIDCASGVFIAFNQACAK